jgi:hypothetical protein
MISFLQVKGRGRLIMFGETVNSSTVSNKCLLNIELHRASRYSSVRCRRSSIPFNWRCQPRIHFASEMEVILVFGHYADKNPSLNPTEDFWAKDRLSLTEKALRVCFYEFIVMNWRKNGSREIVGEFISACSPRFDHGLDFLVVFHAL